MEKYSSPYANKAIAVVASYSDFWRGARPRSDKKPSISSSDLRGQVADDPVDLGRERAHPRDEAFVGRSHGDPAEDLGRKRRKLIPFSGDHGELHPRRKRMPLSPGNGRLWLKPLRTISSGIPSGKASQVKGIRHYLVKAGALQTEQRGSQNHGVHYSR